IDLDQLLRGASGDAARDSARATPRKVPLEHLERLIHRSGGILASALPSLEWVAKVLTDLEAVVYFVDREGTVLWSRGPAPGLVEDAFASPGSNWLEEALGPNAVAEALAGDEPIYAAGSGQGGPSWRRYTTMVVPVHTREGKVAGAVVVAGLLQDVKEDRLSLAAFAAFAAERRLVEEEDPVGGSPKPSREARRRQDEAGRFRRLLDAAPDATVLVDEGGAILFANAQIQSILGYSQEELLGLPVEVLVPEHLRGSHEGHRARFLGDPSAVARGASLEVSARRRDGSEIPVEISLRPVRMREGLLVSAAIRDISARKEALQEINAFSYTIAHDLRSPLRTIASGTQIILEQGEQLGEEARAWGHRIIESATRMDALVTGLLDYSRISRQEIEVGPVEWEGIVEKVLGQMEGEFEERGARVVVEQPLPCVRGHALTLGQALTNLLSNALKFVPAGKSPQVRIRADRGPAAEAPAAPTPGAVRLWVEDQGIGIAPPHLERIFGLFERLHGRETYQGTGIGLAIVKRVVERMGGKVGVESEPGRGSRFYIELPEA
ncbi:MAG TPA: ATP-binding protein, partial [Planctomycetota bacterium]|nr:ATP-binding protein [Planctomycetota bacterium]